MQLPSQHAARDGQQQDQVHNPWLPSQHAARDGQQQDQVDNPWHPWLPTRGQTGPVPPRIRIGSEYHNFEYVATHKFFNNCPIFICVTRNMRMGFGAAQGFDRPPWKSNEMMYLWKNPDGAWACGSKRYADPWLEVKPHFLTSDSWPTIMAVNVAMKWFKFGCDSEMYFKVERLHQGDSDWWDAVPENSSMFDQRHFCWLYPPHWHLPDFMRSLPCPPNFQRALNYVPSEMPPPPPPTTSPPRTPPTPTPPLTRAEREQRVPHYALTPTGSQGTPRTVCEGDSIVHHV